MATAHSYVSNPADEHAADWSTNLERALREPDLIRPVFQPIYDLDRSRVCGYETLARFACEPRHSPVQWLQAARELDLEDSFEAALLEAGLQARATLPENCFLTVNVSPGALLSDPVQAAIERAGRLDAVVIELTEREPVEDYPALVGALELLRSRGGTVAVDDAGAGYASLQHIMSLRPEFIKLDRALVAGLDSDPAKLALVEAVGSFAAHIDAWVVAEGIERRGELDSVRSISVPLGQGFGLGMPAPEMTPGELDRDMRSTLSSGEDRGSGLAAILAYPRPLHETELGLAEQRFATEPGTDFLVIVDSRARPAGMLRRDTRVADVEEILIPPLRVLITEAPDAVARRAMTRPLGRRFDPIVVCDQRGRYIGLVATDQLVHLLSRIINERTRQ
ncbi:MAG: EAL domain-containing protein [Solirubrobacteraceae bacterium]